jgi:ABC-2 type transport system permease protein
MRRFFALAQWAMIFVAPAISMRLLAEEQRTGSIDTLRAAPVGEWAIVSGKHLGAMLFLAAMLAPTLVFVGVLGALARPDYGAIALGYVGLLLLGAFYLAVGSLFSALTASQTVAFHSTLFFVLLLQLASEWLAPMAPAPLDRALFALSLRIRLEDFGKGVLDTAHVVFFLATSAWFLALAVVALQSRRWR